MRENWFGWQRHLLFFLPFRLLFWWLLHLSISRRSQQRLKEVTVKLDVPNNSDSPTLRYFGQRALVVLQPWTLLVIAETAHHPPLFVCSVMSKCRRWRTGNENIPFVPKLTSRVLNYFNISEEPRASADVSSSCGNEKLNVADFTDPQKTSMIYKARTRANDSFPPSESSSFSLNSISDISLTFPATNYKSGGGSGGASSLRKPQVRLLIKSGIRLVPSQRVPD